MSGEINLILLLLSGVLLAMLSGALTAMQLISYVRSERNGEGDEEAPGPGGRLDSNPGLNYVSVGAGRIAAGFVVALAAGRFAAQHLPGMSGVSVLGFAAACVLLPYWFGNVLALKTPERFAFVTRPVVYPVIYVLWPLSLAFVSLLRRLSPRLATMVAFPVLPFKQRLEVLGFANGAEESDEQSLMESVFEFGDTRVHEVMVPRIDMVAVNVHMDAREAMEAIVEAGHSRVPVFDESIDKIVGVVHAKDILKKTIGEDEFSLDDIKREAYFVPESKRIEELLTEFKQQRMHLAIAVDEYGGTAGLITLEDILEELVGEIQDEFDEEEETIRRINDDSVLCSSRIRLDDLNEALGLGLPEEHADTLGGFLYVTIGRVPRTGETLRHNGLVFKVESVVRQRIDKVIISGLRSLERKVENGQG